jgi:Tfp pilus assembly protein PilV
MSNVECRIKKGGFSLMEVLLAVGTLAIGMLFIAGVFPVSIHFVTVATERTIAAVAADEAFAKIKLYGIPPAALAAMSDVNQAPYVLSPAEHAYPSTPTSDPNSKRYWWSAICRQVGPTDVQVTVFVSRKVGTTTNYLIAPGVAGSARPVAISVPFTAVLPAPTYELVLSLDDRMLISDGYTIVDNATGQIYRVLSRTDTATDGIIKLDKLWQGGVSGLVWVVPPPVVGGVSSGRYPCIAVYQKIMSF